MTGGITEIRRYEAPPVCRGEILRYMGCHEETAELRAMIDRAVAACEGKLTYEVCFRLFPVEVCGDEVDLSFFRVKSAALARRLEGCSHAVVFAATVGLALDRLILRHSRLAPSMAVCLQAYGAERIEALCDRFTAELGKRYTTRPRFSPGYGDLPLWVQTPILQALDAPRGIGVTLNESLLMSPSKSVSAIVGIQEGSVTDERT